MAPVAGIDRLGANLVQTRKLFGFSKRFAPALAFPSAKTVFKEKRLMGYKMEKMYELASNTAEYPQFVPFVVDCRLLSKHGIGTPPGSEEQKVLLSVGFQQFKEQYTSLVRLTPSNRVTASALLSTPSPLFKSLACSWNFSPVTPNSCALDFYVE
ncbi:Coenzyme Q-binding protein coq10a, mitochondrial [Kappamyces sp. JEL0680]|nr:Coenzyme Q-binding protein coq10a, mitochondrial [Kappamyces sp. JEL0680]